MKKAWFLLLSFALVSCQENKNTGDKEFLKFNEFPLAVPEQNSLMYKWEQKPVLKTMLIDDMEDSSGWKVTGIGELSYTRERAKDGKQSLRFRTSLRDEEHYRKNRSAWGSFNGTQGGTASVRLKFDKPRDWSDFNRISFWVYVHPTSMPTYCLFLQLENEGSVFTATDPGMEHFIEDLKPGTWNHVLFEIPHLKRNKVTLFEINQMLTGHNPEEEGIVTYDIDQLEVQQVAADQYEGWTVAPGKFAYSHVGYRPADPKIVLAGEGAGGNFQLLDQKNKVVFSGNTRDIENINGVFHQLDFSDFRTPGQYHLRCGSIESQPFPINQDIWLQPVFKAINFFYCERCGFSIPGVHLECHKDWQGFRGDVKKIINGGWHDAGDLSQGAWRTSMAVYSMIENFEGLKDRRDLPELADRIQSELAWGVEWLLKTRFGDGFHMSFSVMRIYTDNKTGTIDDVVSPAQNVPWENFLTSAVFCKASKVLEKSHPELARQAKIAATEDWNAAMSSRGNWDQADYLEAAWGATSSLLLQEMTGDKKYAEYAVRFGDLLIGCQEQRFVDSIPVAGYFYTNTDRKTVIHNFHGSFEEAPLIALAMLCRKLPDHENWMDWYSTAAIHSEYFMKKGSQIASPYDLLPNSVWKKQEILSEKDQKVRMDMLRQFNDGTPLSEDVMLRTFPIYHDGLFHGNTNIHMSCTWALAEASRLRNDTAGMQLAGKQLQWVLGANPFGQSLMYGVGNDFAPHFAYCLRDIVGSLPVGMDCMSGDMPYWSATNTATHKEIWVEPVNRFLGAVAIYALPDNPVTGEKNKDVHIKAETLKNNESITVMITLTGSGKHTLAVKNFNAETDLNKVQVDFSGRNQEKLNLKLKVSDHNKPYVCVLEIDNDPALRKEIIGSYTDGIPLGGSAGKQVMQKF